MEHARPAWPIAIEAMGGGAAGAIAFRQAGRSFVTLVLKATYSIVPEGVATPAPAQPILTAELHQSDDPRLSLRAASDLAPYVRRVDVVLVGHACAPPTGPVQSGGVRLTVYRDDHCVLDKALLVQGDRAQDASGRWFGIIPFSRIPIVYERAAWSAENNPVGIDARVREPNFASPRGWGVPACFGPVARFWPSRRRHLGPIDPRALDASPLVLPDVFDERYFQAAPEDQQLDALRGDEWIVIEGMHPSLPRLRTRLPGARGVARVRGESPGSSRTVELRADLLSLDLDRNLFTLTFRAALPLPSEQVLPALRVLVEAELPGAVKPSLSGAQPALGPPQAPIPAQRSRPPETAPIAPIPAQRSRPPELHDETTFVPADRAPAAPPVMPFAPVPAQRSRPPETAPIAPIPAQRSRPPEIDDEATFVPADRAPAAPPVMPFAPVTPSTTSSLSRSSMSLDRGAAPKPRPRQDLGATMATSDDDEPAPADVMPFAPVTGSRASSLSRSSMSLDRPPEPPPPRRERPQTAVLSMESLRAHGAPLPFTPAHDPPAHGSPGEVSPWAQHPEPPAARPAQSGETAYTPGDLGRAQPATPFEVQRSARPSWADVPAPFPAPRELAPESIAPQTVDLAPSPVLDAPPIAPPPIAPPPIAPPPIAPPPLVSAAPAPTEAGATDAPIEGLGALFLDALPLPPAEPARGARRQASADEGPRAR
ncbi:MAG: DUF2169 domain-containing protein [Byssovorax sp.]